MDYMDLIALYRRASEKKATGIVFGTVTIQKFIQAMYSHVENGQAMMEFYGDDILEPNSEKQVGVFDTIPVYVSNRLKEGYYFKY